VDYRLTGRTSRMVALQAATDQPPFEDTKMPLLTEAEFEALQNTASSPDTEPTIGEVIQQRLGRREVVRGLLASTAIAAVLPSELTAPPAAAAATGETFSFNELKRGVDETHHVAEGYEATVLLRWGDPIFADSPAFDPRTLTAEQQLRLFGYNNDFIGFAPLPQGSAKADNGLLCVNHEYTNTLFMVPGLVPADGGPTPPEAYTKAIAELEMAAHGASIVEVKRDGKGAWSVVRDSKFNRRISTLRTEMAFTGPAAGHKRMQTKADPGGTRVIGMAGNCAGGMTPWGTYLTCEENIDNYFMGKIDRTFPEQRNFDRMTIPSATYGWGRYDERFDVNKEQNEGNRFGWVVEIDPYDPVSMPRKHTALGRFKHEGAGVGLTKDGRVVVFMGDDQKFEHIYRFVSKEKFKPGDRAANMRLLEEGTLSVARFDADGSVIWLPLVHGQGPLTAANGFNSQADVLIEARVAASLLGATRMDRPEDVEVNPKTGKVYALLTNNEDRRSKDWVEKVPAGQVNAANPRPANIWGHIIEMTPPDGDHAAPKFKWEIMIQGGNPADPAVGAQFNAATTADGWFGSPDNCCFDSRARLWVGSDQGSKWQTVTGTADGLYSVETEGALRGTSRLFFRCPVGAEVTGPCFTLDDAALFISVQHPGVDGVENRIKSVRAGFDDPGTRWPDFKPDMPPRPSVVLVTKKGGGPIG
jgi:uncharacterized protein